MIVISVPQVWFPLEDHGVVIGGRPRKGKVFALPYIRPLHRRFAAARVFSSGELDRLFTAGGAAELLATAYVSPHFERAASRRGTWESRVVFLRGVLDRCEKIPVLKELTGVSILKAYRKR
ncbi:MAG TPA: hypothetical protein VMJ34_00560 [Bryobacteraceae bacterium]|nr:hypothetical protein [Bryobacteraceae bacterium]